MFTPDQIKKVKASYKCPSCDTWVKEEFVYIPTQRGAEHPKTESAHWCSRCGARNRIDYRVYKQRNGNPRIKIFKLSSNDEEFVRRFKDLAWC